MKNLCLKIFGISRDNFLLFINGKISKLKKNKLGYLDYLHTTNNDYATIQIINYEDIGGFFWFIFQLFLHIISIFGLLDFWKQSIIPRIDFVVQVHLSADNNVVTLRYNRRTWKEKKRTNELSMQKNESPEDTRAFIIESECEIQSLKNENIIEEKNRKILKRLKIAKILVGLLVALTLIVAIIYIKIIK